MCRPEAPLTTSGHRTGCPAPACRKHALSAFAPADPQRVRGPQRGAGHQRSAWPQGPEANRVRGAIFDAVCKCARPGARLCSLSLTKSVPPVFLPHANWLRRWASGSSRAFRRPACSTSRGGSALLSKQEVQSAGLFVCSVVSSVASRKHVCRIGASSCLLPTRSCRCSTSTLPSRHAQTGRIRAPQACRTLTCELSVP